MTPNHATTGGAAARTRRDETIAIGDRHREALDQWQALRIGTPRRLVCQ
jgi:hypothetical protein